MKPDAMFEEARNGWMKEVTRAQLEYPDENVVRFIASRRRIKDNARLLDFGCGAGRHSVAATKMGYRVTAMDCNSECIDMTFKRIKDNFGIEIPTMKNEYADVPSADKSFDYIVSWGTIFCNKKSACIEIMEEFNRVLDDGGEVFADWRTQDDYLYGCGQEIEKDFFHLDESSGRPGFLYYFPSLETIKDIYSEGGFEVTNVEKYEFTQLNMTRLNSWYHVTAKKIREV